MEKSVYTNSTWWLVFNVARPIQIEPDLYVRPQHDGELLVMIQLVPQSPFFEEPPPSGLLPQGDQVLWDVYLEDILSTFPRDGLQQPPGV